MRSKTPVMFWPTIIRWNLDDASKKVMGLRWCEWKRKEQRRMDIMEKAFGAPSSQLARDMVYNGPRQEWV